MPSSGEVYPSLVSVSGSVLSFYSLYFSVSGSLFVLVYVFLYAPVSVHVPGRISESPSEIIQPLMCKFQMKFQLFIGVRKPSKGHQTPTKESNSSKEI